MSMVIERLKSGPSVCLDDFAAAWAEQEARADYLMVVSKKDWLLRELAAAVRGGQLQVFDTVRKGPRPFRQGDEAELLAARLRVSPASVNAWLAGERLAELDGLPNVPAAPAGQFASVAAESEPVRYDLLATRAELVAAFGVWGLNMDMFKNLKERRWLMDARIVKGQGQRGHVIEPLFCPFAVMQGLATKTKQPKISECKGWDILENKFKAVFEENQQFDPRERTG